MSDEEQLIDDRRVGKERYRRVFKPDGVHFSYTSFTLVVGVSAVIWKASPVISAWGTLPLDVREQGVQVASTARTVERMSLQLGEIQRTAEQSNSDIRVLQRDLAEAKTRVAAIEAAISAVSARQDRVEAQITTWRGR